MPIDRLLEDLIREKATAMLGSAGYRKYAKAFAHQAGDVEKAFLAGALDAMSYDVGAIRNPRRIPSREDREKLIKDILKEKGVDKS